MVHVVILAGGKGTRMKSELPKVLHPVKGIPIIQRLLATVTQIDPKPTIIIGHRGQDVIDATQDKYDYVEQREQLGTGHAVKIAAESLKGLGIKTLVVLPGDHPLISVETLRNLIENHAKSNAAVSLCTAKISAKDPHSMIFNNYGRIVRNAAGDVEQIVEFKDATEEQKAIREFNLSYYCFDAKWLFDNIDQLLNQNASGEYYLTDMIQVAKQQGRHVEAYLIENVIEALGINSQEQLHMVEQAITEIEK